MGQSVAVVAAEVELKAAIVMVVVVAVVVLDLRLGLSQVTHKCDQVIGCAQMKAVQTTILLQEWFAKGVQKPGRALTKLLHTQIQPQYLAAAAVARESAVTSVLETGCVRGRTAATTTMHHGMYAACAQSQDRSELAAVAMVSDTLAAAAEVISVVAAVVGEVTTIATKGVGVGAEAEAEAQTVTAITRAEFRDRHRQEGVAHKVGAAPRNNRSYV